MPKMRPRIMLWSIHKGLGWPTQLQTMERWLQRVRDAENEFDEIDFYLAFFLSCHHFPEWLKHTGGISNRDLSDYVSRHPELGICRDLANASKHWALRSKGDQFEVALVRESAPGDRFGHRLLVIADERNYAAWDLAQRCLGAWQRFIDDKSPKVDASFEDLIERFPDQ